MSPAASQLALLRCAHFDSGECRSCTLLPVPTEERLARTHEQVAALLDPFAEAPHAAARPPSGDESFAEAAETSAPVPSSYWLEPVRSPLEGFRNKAKMMVTGTVEEPVLGIADASGVGVDLADCPLYPAPVHAVLDALPALIRRAQVPPYSIRRRRGQLKHVLVTVSPAGEMMVRFVLSSPAPVERIREHIGLLVDAVPGVRVVTANIQPEHSAVIEGAEELHLWGADTLVVRQGRVPLRVRPQSFLQTNSQVASRLYEQVADWVDAAEAAIGSGVEAAGSEGSAFVVWDLFCGVGGFALHCAHPLGGRARRRVIGVEVSSQAIDAARSTARELGLDAEFHAADAGAFASAATDRSSADPTLPRPHLLIVNPPRRGLGQELAAWIEAAGAREVVYSSCNPATLARDLRSMPSYRITTARLLDMFPHTPHSEVVVRLRRAGV